MLSAMFAMVLLVFAVFFYGITIRVSAVRRGQVHPAYFRVFDARGKAVPDRLVQLKNHIDNLFQMPLLFLLVGILTLNYGPDGLATVLAWAYVSLRALHSFIHLTYNRVTHRLVAFVLSNMCLLILWVRVVFVLS